MNPGFTKTEAALLEALEAERALLKQRNLAHGIIVHEMSNALTIILSGLELHALSPPDSTAAAIALKEVREGARTLRELFTGLHVLLDEGASPLFEKRDITAFVRDLVADRSFAGDGAMERVKIRIRVAERMQEICPILLRHALGNLLRNALRYSPASQPVTVTIGGRGDRYLWIHVLNRGPKIPETVARRLFEPGKKSPNGGMGFGMHIAQSCAARMGGRLVFGSTVCGTVFTLILKADVPPRPDLRSVAMTESTEQPWGVCRSAEQNARDVGRDSLCARHTSLG